MSSASRTYSLQRLGRSREASCPVEHAVGVFIGCLGNSHPSPDSRQRQKVSFGEKKVILKAVQESPALLAILNNPTADEFEFQSPGCGADSHVLIVMQHYNHACDVAIIYDSAMEDAQSQPKADSVQTVQGLQAFEQIWQYQSGCPCSYTKRVCRWSGVVTRIGTVRKLEGILCSAAVPQWLMG